MTDQELRRVLNKHKAFTEELFSELVSKLDLESSKTLEDRKEEFKESLKPFVDKYGRDMIFKFFTYWSEGVRKMRFEKQKTFDIALRLRKWSENEKKFSIVNMLKK